MSEAAGQSKIYVGHVSLGFGKAWIQTDASREPIPARTWGEVVFRGHLIPFKETLVVERLLRFAVRCEPVDPKIDARVQVFTLTGPIRPGETTPGESGTVENFLAELYYTELSNQARIKGEYTHTRVEKVWADLIWDPAPKGNDQVGAALSITVKTKDFDEKVLGVVSGISLQFPALFFKQTRPAAQMIGLTGAPLELDSRARAAGTGSALNCIENPSTVSLKFINFSPDLSDDTDFQNFIQPQLDTARAIWSDQGDFELVEDAARINAPGATDPTNSSICYSEFTDANLEIIGGHSYSPHDNASYQSATSLEVYFVHRIYLTLQGEPAPVDLTAVCIDKLGDPYILIKVEPGGSACSDTLLAHELGEFLKLQHPQDTADARYLPSSYGSVTQPGVPNPSYNTLYNFRVFGSAVPALNSLIGTQSVSGYFYPGGDFFIRDFPTDCGTEPAALPPGQYYFDNCCVWNRRSSDPGSTTPGSIEQQDPYNSDTTNYLFVELEFTNGIWNPVNIDLYFTTPSATTGDLTLEAVNAGTTAAGQPANRILYQPPTPPALPASPVILNLPWHPDDMPGHWSSHACVFAVASVPELSSPIDPYTPLTCDEVSGNVLESNKIVQRNLDFLLLPPPGGGSYWFWTPWLHIVKQPTLQKPPALVIETLGSGGLGGLRVEFDTGETEEIRPGGVQRIQQYEQMRPGEIRTLRIAAQIPARARVRETFPINLFTMVGEKKVAGYQHRLKISTMREAVESTADWLYGALKAAAAGCELEQARPIARKIRAIVRRRNRNVNDKLGALANLGAEIRELSDCLPPEGHIDHQAVKTNLAKMADALAGLEKAPTPQAIAELRDLIDRVYEPASRLARMSGH